MTTSDYDYLAATPKNAETIRALPTPRDLFRGYVRGGYGLFDAVAEYVDNSIDQGIRTRRSRSNNIDVLVGYDGNEFFIQIHDTAGGCLRTNAANFIQPGKTTVDPLETGISRFGIGGKVAGVSVAKKVMVYSKVEHDRGFFTILDKDALLKQDTWDFQLFDIPLKAPVKDGETAIVLYGVPKEAHNGYPESYLSRFGERYGLLLVAPGSPRISIGGTSVAPVDPFGEMLSAAEAPAECVPRVFTKSEVMPLIDDTGVSRTGTVTAKITVGLLPERSTTGRAGAKIYCNRRQVVSCTELGLVEGSSLGAIRRAHPESDQVWMRAIVEVSGPAELMPWTNRKDALDASSPSFGFVYSHLVDAYQKFLQENVAPLKLKVRRDHGIKDPDIFDILKFSYATRISGGRLKPDGIRPRVKSSRAFQASRELKLEEATESEEDVTPEDRTISASIEVDKIAQVKATIRRVRREAADPSNAELVRIVLEHYLACPEIRKSASGGK